MEILQEKYGIAKEEAKQQVGDFKKSIDQLKKANANLLQSQKALGKKKRNRMENRCK